MKRMSVINPVLLSFAVCSAAMAAPGVANVEFAGSGCEQNDSVKIDPSSITSAIEIFFSDYQAAAGIGTGWRAEQKNCNLVFSLVPPKGHSVEISALDYGGESQAAAPASNLLVTEIKNLSVATGYRTRYQNFVVQGRQSLDYRLYRSRCGKELRVRLNTMIRARSNAYGDLASITLNERQQPGIRLVYTLQKCL